jgi:hypothetical protein
MKLKFALLVLIGVCVALGVALLATQRKAEEQRQTDTRTIHTLTNQLDAWPSSSASTPFWKPTSTPALPRSTSSPTSW